MADNDRTASLMTPSKLAQVKPRGPVSPAAWLDQMAADAGHQHVRRLAELCKDLQAQAQRRDISPLILELERLGEALPRLDFGLLQPRGWWARATGKGRTAGTEFAGQFEQIAQVAQGLLRRPRPFRKASRTNLRTARCWNWKSSSGRSTRSSIRARAGCTTCATRSRSGRLHPPTTPASSRSGMTPRAARSWWPASRRCVR